MVLLRAQQNQQDTMSKLQETSLREGYPENPNPPKRPKLVVVEENKLKKKNKDEEGYNSMDDDEMTNQINSQIGRVLFLSPKT